MLEAAGALQGDPHGQAALTDLDFFSSFSLLGGKGARALTCTFRNMVGVTVAGSINPLGKKKKKRALLFKFKFPQIATAKHQTHKFQGMKAYF